MLTPEQKKYLESIPGDKKIFIQDFNPEAKKAANEIIKEIGSTEIESMVLNMGSTELEIAGQNDIDITVASSQEKYKKELPILKKLFGNPKQEENLPMKWEFTQNDFEVELHLSDASTSAFKEHLDVFTELKHNSALHNQYEEIKKSCNGKSFKEYMRKKYEFFNEILEDTKGKPCAVSEGESLR